MFFSRNNYPIISTLTAAFCPILATIFILFSLAPSAYAEVLVDLSQIVKPHEAKFGVSRQWNSGTHTSASELLVDQEATEIDFTRQNLLTDDLGLYNPDSLPIVFDFDSHGNPVHNLSRIMNHFDDAVARYGSNIIVNVFGMPMLLAANSNCQGSSSVTKGSNAVNGVGTTWGANEVGRTFHFLSDPSQEIYQVAAVESSTRLRLTRAYNPNTKTNARFCVVLTNQYGWVRGQPSNYSHWTALIQDIVQHFITRYGQQVVDSWKFEIWNEPDLVQLFWIWKNGDPNLGPDVNEYVRFYQSTYNALRSLLPNAKIGPNFAGPGTETEQYMRGLYNAGAQLQMLTLHQYSISEHSHIRNYDLLDAWPWGPALGQLFDFSQIEVYLTELGPNALPQDIHLHSSSYAASYLLSVFIDLTNLGVSNPKKRFEGLTWFEPVGSHFRYGFGLFSGVGTYTNSWWDGEFNTSSSNGAIVARPSYRAMEMLHQMSGNVVRSQQSGATSNLLRHYAVHGNDANTGKETLWLTLTNFVPTDWSIQNTASISGTFEIQGLGSKSINKVELFNLPNPYSYWQNVLGAPGDLGGSNPNPITAQQISQVMVSSNFTVQNLPVDINTFTVGINDAIILKFTLENDGPAPGNSPTPTPTPIDGGPKATPTPNAQKKCVGFKVGGRKRQVQYFFDHNGTLKNSATANAVGRVLISSNSLDTKATQRAFNRVAKRTNKVASKKSIRKAYQKLTGFTRRYPGQIFLLKKSDMYLHSQEKIFRINIEQRGTTLKVKKKRISSSIVECG